MNTSLYHPFSHLLRGFDGAEHAAGFRVDIEETEKAYRLHADLPGAEKNNISVNVEDNVLTVAAKIERGSKNTVHSERAGGDFSRAFRLPRRVDSQNIAASMKNGVLTVVVPKAEDSAGRKIEIH